MRQSAPAPIRPRTEDERLAFVSGYAAAVNDIAKHGVKFGSDHVRLMVETEPKLRSVLEGES
jgi:hypothetical protein